ncbi:hypothetical protein Droror1_Dr00019953 [Drosera rotundifolia]
MIVEAEGDCTVAQFVLEETHTRTVRSCAWSPSGKMLATASFDATIAVWQVVIMSIYLPWRSEIFHRILKVQFFDDVLCAQREHYQYPGVFCAYYMAVCSVDHHPELHC